MVSVKNQMNSMVSTGNVGHIQPHRNVEPVYKVPDFQHAYKKHPAHPLTEQYNEEAHKFLASHRVDQQLGPEKWSSFLAAKSPELVGFVLVGTEPKDLLWCCKLMGIAFAIDTVMEEGEYSDSPDKSCATVLDMTLPLLWHAPDTKRLLEHLEPIYECITTEESRALVKTFHENLAHARNKTKSLVDIPMVPLASAFRELWIEYCEVVPVEFLPRQADVIQDYIMGCVWEAKNRKAGAQIRSVAEYVPIRRLSAGVLPFIISSDMLIAGREDPIPQIPNCLFYGTEMQSLLLAINDILGWLNDILSFYKEVIVAEDGHNLVKVLCEERNCATYNEAGQLALQLMHDRIADMERACVQLKAVSSPEYHPAIERYIESCRNSISGSHQWLLISTRYQMTDRGRRVTM